MKKRKYYGTMYRDNNDKLAVKLYRELVPKGTKNTQIIRYFQGLIVRLCGDLDHNNQKNIGVEKEELYSFLKSLDYSDSTINNTWKELLEELSIQFS